MRLILIALLLVHTFVTWLVMKDFGYWSVFPPYSEFYVNQIFSDLVVSLGIVTLFIFRELKFHKKSLAPLGVCCVGMFFLGSISPLIYLLCDQELLRPRN